MTRKKFVKQLMAQGYQRNTAEGVAMYARLGGWTYEQYLHVSSQNQAFYRAVENLKICVAESFAQVAKAATDAVKKAREAFTTYSLTPAYKAWQNWINENGVQSKEQRPTDMLDAVAYAQDPLQSIEQEPAQEWPKENPQLGGGAQ